MKSYTVGVDVGGTSVKLGLFRTDGTLLKTKEIPTYTENEGSRILPDIANAVEEMLAEENIDKSDVEGLGLGVPGPVTADGIVHACVNLNWGFFNVVEAMEKLIGIPVKADNDANVAALGEMWQGGGRGCKNLVMVTLGTAVGGGVVVDGKVISGSTGAAGEIGHLCVNPDETLACGCGNKGCLEQYASAKNVARVAKEYLEAHPDEETSLRGFEVLTSKELFEEAVKGDAVAKQLTEDFGAILGRGLALVSCVSNPEVFVLGGGLSKAGDVLIGLVQPYFKKYAFHASRDTAFAIAELGNDAGIYGSAYLTLQ